jgi:hypothetical protein
VIELMVPVEIPVAKSKPKQSRAQAGLKPELEPPPLVPQLNPKQPHAF